MGSLCGLRLGQNASLILNINNNDPQTIHQVAETRSRIDCPINDPDAILQIMFSGRQVNWTIMGHSSLCYLMNGHDFMKGRRLGPKTRHYVPTN